MFLPIYEQQNLTLMSENNSSFSEPSFWKKLSKVAAFTGKQSIEKILILYYCFRDPDTPKGAKSVILSALGYFVLPLDVIPDLAPGIGYTDDFGVIALALMMVAIHIKAEHKEYARAKMDIWFETT